MKPNAFEQKILRTAESRTQAPRVTETTFMVPRIREFHASATPKHAADTTPTAKKPEVTSAPARSEDMTTPPFKILMKLQNETAWNDPKDPRNKAIDGKTAISFLQRVATTVTDFAGQIVFWTAAPLMYGLKKGADSKGTISKYLYPVVGIAATTALLFVHVPYATLAITSIGLAAGLQRLITGRSSFPRARDILGKLYEWSQTK